MSHEVSQSNGVAEAAYSLKPAWHKLGTVVNHAMNSEEALKAAHLDWEVQKFPLYCRERGGSGRFIPADNCYMMMRTDNNTQLGPVGNRYTPIQNTEAFSFLDSLFEGSRVTYESCGALFNGQYVWMLVRLDEHKIQIKDDVTQPYLLLWNTHDGSAAATIMPTAVRVVCYNTLNLALDGKPELKIRIIHSGNTQEKLVYARRVFQEAMFSFSTHEQQLNGLSVVPVRGGDDLDVYVRYIVPMPDEPSDRTRERVERERAEILSLFEHPTNDIDGVRHRALAAYNAATYWADHYYVARGNEDTRASYDMLSKMSNEGRMTRFKRRALERALNWFRLRTTDGRTAEELKREDPSKFNLIGQVN